jgi:hypothetical protein
MTAHEGSTVMFMGEMVEQKVIDNLKIALSTTVELNTEARRIRPITVEPIQPEGDNN